MALRELQSQIVLYDSNGNAVTVNVSPNGGSLSVEDISVTAALSEINETLLKILEVLED